MQEKKTIKQIWLEERNRKSGFWVVDDAGFYFFVVAIAPNNIAIGWDKAGRDHSFGALSPEWYFSQGGDIEQKETAPVSEKRKRFAYEISGPSLGSKSVVFYLENKLGLGLRIPDLDYEA